MFDKMWMVRAGTATYLMDEFENRLCDNLDNDTKTLVPLVKLC